MWELVLVGVFWRLWVCFGACGKLVDLGDPVSLAADEPRPSRLGGWCCWVGGLVLVVVGRIAFFLAPDAGCFWEVAACGCW